MLHSKMDFANVVEKMAYVASCDAKMISIAKEIIENIKNLKEMFFDEADAKGYAEAITVGFEESIMSLEDISEKLQASVDCLEKAYQNKHFTFLQKETPSTDEE